MPIDLSLRDQIVEAMKPWKDAKDKPPFSAEELVLMALVSTDGPMSKADISKWVAESAGYYHQLAVKAFFGLESCEWTNDICVQPWEEDAEQAKDELIDALHDSFMVTAFRRVGSGPAGHDTWSATGGEAFSLLKPCLAPIFPEIYGQGDASKPFPFFRLPAEIRISIYDMAYSYGLGGVEVECGDSWRCARREHGVLSIVQTTESIVFDSECWDYYDNTRAKWIVLSKVGKLLQSLLVCKQYYHEALPSFFTTNTFYCRNVDALQYFLKSLVPSRRALLTNLAFAYCPDKFDVQAAPKTFALLAGVPRLRSLDIQVDEKAWSSRLKRSGHRMYPDLAKLPSFSALKKVKVSCDVVFHKTNAATAEVLGAAILRPTSETTERRSKVKRVGKIAGNSK